MLNPQINLDKEAKKLLEEFLREIKNLNEHLSDYKKMVAPWLGFRVKTGEKK